MLKFILSLILLTRVVHSSNDVDCYFLNAAKLPLVVSTTETRPLQSWIDSHKEELRALLKTHGALLLRDFSVDTPNDFVEIVKALVGSPMHYIGEGSRTKIVEGVYTSTEAPPSVYIPLHHELTCTNDPISYFCLYCEIAPEPGSGQTIIGRTEDITLKMMKYPALWSLFADKTLKYISRHPPKGSIYAKINKTHRTWQESFETEDKQEVERICQENNYEFHWHGEWLEVIRHVPAIHPSDDNFDYPYWYNQAHLYDINPRLVGGGLKHILANLVYFDPMTRQYDIEFEDGSKIPREAIYQVYDILEQEVVKFDWKAKDVLILDNKKTAHGRATYSGPRRVLVSFVP